MMCRVVTLRLTCVPGAMTASYAEYPTGKVQ
jgi:hypothetical protein